jgi:hypothetical protein
MERARKSGALVPHDHVGNHSRDNREDDRAGGAVQQDLGPGANPQSGNHGQAHGDQQAARRPVQPCLLNLLLGVPGELQLTQQELQSGRRIRVDILQQVRDRRDILPGRGLQHVRDLLLSPGVVEFPPRAGGYHRQQKDHDTGNYGRDEHFS